MIDVERIEDLCERLALGTMASHLPKVAEEAARGELSFQEFFEQLLRAEYRERQERSRTLLTRTAGFPSVKTLDQYDFALAAGAPRQLFTELAQTYATTLGGPSRPNLVSGAMRAFISIRRSVSARSGLPGLRFVMRPLPGNTCVATIG
jgi:DNA replication protein DnaC